MEDSHFNSSYFWSPISAHIENAMFLNKMKEQQEKASSFSSSSASHYQTALLTIPSAGSKSEGGGQAGSASHLHPPHSTQNITVLPVPSTGIMTAGESDSAPRNLQVCSDKKEGDGAPHVVVMPTPSKRGRKKKTTVTISSIGGQGHETIMLAQALTGGSQSDMQIHSKSHTEAKPHKCPHCAKSFANSSYLAQHIRIHSGAKPYSCSYCQKSFRQLSHLQHYLAQHIRIHTGVKPYSCSYCEKSFRQLIFCLVSLCHFILFSPQSHRRQHNKDKPYKCPNCNKGYIDAASLEVHMSTHTVKHARIYSCGLCNRSYTSVRQIGSNQNIPCPFDLHQYKTVSANDLQYKPVSVSDISSHKDLCLTVSASAIQVEHLNS
uniref:Zinc finger protein 384 b n=1 Tax=Cynoglossus semilaevis TaxID=244447 RepID=A0A3P8WZI8_CYNSE